MKITLGQINSFTKNIPTNIKAVLLYGVDLGLIKDLSNSIRTSFLGKNYQGDSITELDANTLKKEPQLLNEALLSDNLFFQNQKKIVVLTNCSSTVSSIIEDALNNVNQYTLLLLLAEDLPSTNSLRKLAEKENSVAAIACYHDSIDTLKSYISNTLSANNYTIENSALNYLVNNLGNDRLITKQEINKLMLYKGDNKTISLSDVLSVISNNSDLALSEIVFDITLGNQIEVYSNLQQFLLNFPAIVVVRSLNNSFRRLLTAKQLQNENLPINIIANRLKPPVLFLHIEKLKRQLSIWSTDNINTYLSKLVDLELSIKTNPNLALVLLNKLTLEIALKVAIKK